MSGFRLFSLKDILNELGEEEAKNCLSFFSCPLNPDVEKFLHDKAILFEERSYSSTYLVYASYKKDWQLAGYFTLANKLFTISRKAVNQKTSNGKSTNLSNRMRKQIGEFGKYDKNQDAYIISAPLIGQLGRNFSSGNGKDKLITGDELIKIACDKVWELQRFLSGRVVYLECEDKPKLIDFYESNGFVEFGKRPLDSDEKDDLSGDYLIQMLKDLKACYSCST